MEEVEGVVSGASIDSEGGRSVLRALRSGRPGTSCQAAGRRSPRRYRRRAEVAKLEARPLLGAAKGTLAHLLAESGKTVEAQEELVQAIALFARLKMTIQLERARATLSKFSDL